MKAWPKRLTNVFFSEYIYIYIYILILNLYDYNFDTKISPNGVKWKNCGETEIRTRNFLLSRQIVYQLTYLTV